MKKNYMNIMENLFTGDKDKTDKHSKNKKQKIPYGQYLNRQPGQPGSGWFKYFLIFAFFWILATYLFRYFGGPQRIEIAYTEFKDEVRNGNVESIIVQGINIQGKFKNQYTEVTEGDSASFILFNTVKPNFEDTGLIELLEQNNVAVNAEPESSNWLMYMLILILPWLLIFGYFVYVRKKMQGGMGKGMMQGGLFGVGKSKAKRFNAGKSDITFKDVAGLENAKKDLQEIIDYLKNPSKFTKLGADIPKGVLLMGPPGTGKTLLARASAGEAGVTFFSISGSEFIEMFVGVGASRVRDMFETAKRESPSIIFIDEIDSVGRARGAGLGGGHDEREQTLNQILSEMDGFEQNQSVVVMAATNRPDVLDAALTRPGRFDRRVTLELPQRKARKKILEIHTREVPISEEVNLENIAARTVSFSGADLKNLVNEAALLAGRKQKQKVEPEDFDEARDKILLGAEREEVVSDEERKVVAYHEAGHALLALLLPDTDPLQKVTIIPRGRSLGVTEQVPEIDRYNMKKGYLLNRISVALGGRAAEKIIFNDFTTGAANDLKQVTSIAKKMVCQWGMSDKIGPVTYKQGEEHVFLGREMSQPKDFSEHTARIIDEEVQSLIKQMEEKAEETLRKNRVKLDAIAEALMENETLEKEQISWILEKIE